MSPLGVQSQVLWVMPISHLDHPEKEVDSHSGWKGSGIETLESKKAFLQATIQAWYQAGTKDILDFSSLSLWRDESRCITRAVGERFSCPDAVCRANSIPSREEGCKVCSYHAERDMPSNNEWPLGKIFIRSSKEERLYSRMTKIWTSMSNFFQIIAMVEVKDMYDSVPLKAK